MQLCLPFGTRSAGLRVIEGGGPRRLAEAISTPDAAVRLLVEAGADLLLRRITPERAQEIEQAVNRVLNLFERVEKSPKLEPALKHELNALQTLMNESRSRRKAR